MEILPQGTHLGKLSIIEVYEYYDIPCLFACQNASKHIFLASWASQDKLLGMWLYVPLSPERWQEIRTGKIDLQSAFLEAEDGFVYEVIIPCDDSGDQVKAIACSDLSETKLPEKGSYLSLPNLLENSDREAIKDLQMA